MLVDQNCVVILINRIKLQLTLQKLFLILFKNEQFLKIEIQIKSAKLMFHSKALKNLNTDLI